jgi:hypothetical protein
MFQFGLPIDISLSLLKRSGRRNRMNLRLQRELFYLSFCPAHNPDHTLDRDWSG